jgi:pimeloyl-ACP methyl ester carboxylesterase
MSLFCRLYAPSATSGQIAHLSQLQVASATREGAARLRDAVDRFDVSEVLSRVAAPTLLLHARGDAVQPVEQSEMMARLLPNAVFVPLEGDDHVPLPHTPAWTTLMTETERFLADA